MKKIFCLVMTLVMLFTVAVPMFEATAAGERIPIIEIHGDSDPLYDKNGNKILAWEDLLKSDEDDGSGTANLVQSIANVIYPFAAEGLLTDNWDNYYKALQKEIGDLLGDSILDNNGEASNGSGVSKSSLERNEYQITHDTGNDYRFYYDWRLDPWETAELFKNFIDSIKKNLGVKEVGIVCSCLGTSVVTAYLARYGYEGIHGVSFGAAISNGAELLSDPISGHFGIDGNAISRFLVDCNAYGWFSIPELVSATVDLLAKGGVIDFITDDIKEHIYYRVLSGVTSALSLSTFFTWPCYWSGVTADDYEDALYYVFGEEGSEKREEYAGLIAKLENYNEKVRKHIPEIMNGIKESGANLCIMVKYGSQMGPIIEESDKLGDQLVSVERASYGATTSTIYGTLSDEYIAQRVAEGKGKYISPDKQIDASTCMFPDYTYFIKGLSHSSWGPEKNIMFTSAVADRQLTIDDFEYTQFMRHYTENRTTVPLTEENCDSYNWTASEKEDKPTNKHDRLFAFLKSLFKWLGLIFARLFNTNK